MRLYSQRLLLALAICGGALVSPFGGAAPNDAPSEVSWRWSAPPSMANTKVTLVAPLVTELGGEPVVAILRPSGHKFWDDSTLHVLDGRSGRPMWTLRQLGGHAFAPSGQVTQVDADLCAPALYGGLLCLDERGQFSGLRPSTDAISASWPVHADVDADGHEDLVVRESDWPVKGWTGFVVRAP